MSKKTKYNLIFSLGAACSCSQTLRRAGLQQLSYPFDWLYGNELPGRIQILLDDFAHFLDKEDLSFYHENRSDRCYAYRNKHNQLVFNHDFPMQLGLDAHPQVWDKYQRRIKRLQDNLQCGPRVLAVYMQVPNENSPLSVTPQIQILWEKLQQKYAATQLDLCVISQYPSYKPEQFDVQQITPHITLIRANYKSLNPKDVSYAVNVRFAARLMKKLYRLNLPFSVRCKRFWQKVGIELIPFSEKRHQLKKKYHFY